MANIAFVSVDLARTVYETHILDVLIPIILQPIRHNQMAPHSSSTVHTDQYSQEPVYSYYELPNFSYFILSRHFFFLIRALLDLLKQPSQAELNEFKTLLLQQQNSDDSIIDQEEMQEGDTSEEGEKQISQETVRSVYQAMQHKFLRDISQLLLAAVLQMSTGAPGDQLQSIYSMALYQSQTPDHLRADDVLTEVYQTEQQKKEEAQIFDCVQLISTLSDEDPESVAEQSVTFHIAYLTYKTPLATINKLTFPSRPHQPIARTQQSQQLFDSLEQLLPTEMRGTDSVPSANRHADEMSVLENVMTTPVELQFHYAGSVLKCLLTMMDFTNEHVKLKLLAIADNICSVQSISRYLTV